MLALAHKEHGRRPWSSLSATRYPCRSGIVFRTDGAMMNMSYFPQTHTPTPSPTSPSRAGGARHQAGDTMRNPAYAATLKALASEGPKCSTKVRLGPYMYAKCTKGRFPAPSNVRLCLSGHGSSGLCRPHKILPRLLGAAPAGGVGVLELLGILEHTNIAGPPADRSEGWRTFVQASRLTYGRPDYYEGDPDFVKVPSPACSTRRTCPPRPPRRPRPSPPPGDSSGGPATGADANVESEGTSHFVIVDAGATWSSMTTTVESIFARGGWSTGFFLNTSSPTSRFRPTSPTGGGRPSAGGRQAPALVDVAGDHLRYKGHVVAAGRLAGRQLHRRLRRQGAGGLIDWRLTLREAVALPNLVAGAQRGGGIKAPMRPSSTTSKPAPAGARGAGENFGPQRMTVTKPATWARPTQARGEAVATEPLSIARPPFSLS